MNATEVVGYAMEDGYCLCPGCYEGKDGQPIFAGSEWDNYPTCDHCSGLIDEVSLTAPRFEDTSIETWFERDRQHVELRDKRTNETLIEWWDEEVTEEVEAGFLDPRDYHKSAWETYKHRR